MTNAINSVNPHCILCGMPTEIVGVYMPGPAGIDPLAPSGGKQRYIIYRLCGLHDRTDDATLEMVERKLLDAVNSVGGVG